MDNYIKKELWELVKGDIILHPIYRSDGLLFITKYKRLSQSLIIHLQRQFPKTIEVLIVSNEDELNDFLAQNMTKDTGFLKDLTQIVDKFKEHMNATEIDVANYIEATRSTYIVQKQHDMEDLEEFLSSPLWKQVNALFDSIRMRKRASGIREKLSQILTTDPDLNKLYISLKSYHHVLFVHSINTAIISFTIGLTLELSDEEMVELTIAALYSDIGFIKSPRTEFISYLNFERDEELMRSHIKASVELISTSAYCRRKNIVYGIYDHHEFYDGKGTPMQKKSDDIHLFGRIIAISQAYDEMVGGYLKERSVHTFEAQEKLWKSRGERIDPNILNLFLARSNLYKIGETIMLSNNFSKGTIIGFTNFIDYPLYPKVRLKNGITRDIYHERVLAP